jgi:hypothetical protein
MRPRMVIIAGPPGSENRSHSQLAVLALITSIRMIGQVPAESNPLAKEAVAGLPNDALRHYEAGFRIGEPSLSGAFDYGLLPWGWIDNRPFLQCMHGYGCAFGVSESSKMPSRSSSVCCG